MPKLSLRVAGFALSAVLAGGGAGCSQIGVLKARMAFKDANLLYEGQDYRGAAAKYEEALEACSGGEGECTDPNLTAAYFFLGNSYDNLYRPARRGEAQNDEYIQKAIDNYKKSAESEQDQKIRQLALQYLVAAYGPDKLNDPAEAEPVVQRMIELEPNEPNNYFALANIYEQNGEYERAEELLVKAREVRPSDPAVYMQLARFYNSQGDFEKTMEALNARAQQEPNNPEAYYTIATYYWEKAYRDFTIGEPQKVQYVQSGLQAVDRAIELKPDYFEALTYKNLLLRVQANLEKNPSRQQALLKEADTFRDRAQEVRNKQRAAGASE